ncbi:Peptidase, U7 family [Nitrincola lacisaponensis]|uniref:Peptidase, U7 family n=1 Tax=Nitrincola lacisaponensis TaxID=267850 RepID=A0A063Y4A5_9GAMM|nr:protease SohB [Nitrincola lacisaponensis]KDE39372.1 Peptidase, U7 family [Nitrincola lacisaponensis]
MIEFLTQYGLFLAKTATLVVALLLVVVLLVSLASRRRHHQAEGHIDVKNLNDKYKDMYEALEESVLDEELLRQRIKQERKQEKADAKARRKAAKKGELEEEDKKRIYVIDFDGDISASATDHLREEITAILSIARPEQDEVVLNLESPGGMVHAYGFAASQLERLRRKKIPLTVCVDKVAASGGYMMACIADRILAAPFAVVGSIGVVAQLPNFHRLLKKHDIDYEVLTAGEYKRTLTVFGQNTEKGREKFIEELEETHQLFKDFVREYRPSMDIAKVATGEIWYGRQALEQGLVDGLMTSDEYLCEAANDADLYKVHYEHKKGLQDRLGELAADSSDRVLMRWWQRISQRPLM